MLSLRIFCLHGHEEDVVCIMVCVCVCVCCASLYICRRFVLFSDNLSRHFRCSNEYVVYCLDISLVSMACVNL